MPEELQKVVGERIKWLRIRRGWLQDDLSALLQHAGIAIQQPTLSRIERGERALDMQEMLGFAVVLGISPLGLILPDEEIEAGGRAFDEIRLRDFWRGLIVPGWADALAYSDGMPADERSAYRLAGVERLVVAVTDRLLRAIGEGEKKLALDLLADIERTVGTIRDELTEGSP
jgi:transcriptional regulator with XRE-family HTH domain